MAHLYVKVYQHTNFNGHYRWIVYDCSNISTQLGFNDTISSIRVYRGNEYQPGDVARFYEHASFTGGYLNLGPGNYSNIHIQPFNFGDKISSVDIRPYVHPGYALVPRLRVRIYEHINYGGQWRDVLTSQYDLNSLDFNDTVSSIRVYAEEDYQEGWVCDFFEHNGYTGGMLSPGEFGPGTYIPNIKEAPYSFNDKISSIRFRRITD